MATGKKILGVTLGIVGILFVGKVGLGFLNQPDDKTLITEAVKEAQQAGKEGKPGVVLDFLSKGLKVNGTEVDVSRSEISKYINNSKPDIELAAIEPIITGDDARIETQATLKIGVAMFSKTVTIPNVVVNLRKEVDHQWLIIPKKSWKVTQIRASVDDLTSLFMGN